MAGQLNQQIINNVAILLRTFTGFNPHRKPPHLLNQLQRFLGQIKRVCEPVQNVRLPDMTPIQQLWTCMNLFNKKIFQEIPRESKYCDMLISWDRISVNLLRLNYCRQQFGGIGHWLGEKKEKHQLKHQLTFLKFHKIPETSPKQLPTPFKASLPQHKLLHNPDETLHFVGWKEAQKISKKSPPAESRLTPWYLRTFAPAPTEALVGWETCGSLSCIFIDAALFAAGENDWKRLTWHSHDTIWHPVLSQLYVVRCALISSALLAVSGAVQAMCLEQLNKTSMAKNETLVIECHWSLQWCMSFWCAALTLSLLRFSASFVTRAGKWVGKLG